MPDTRRIMGPIATGALSLGLAAVALWSAADRWRRPARLDQENRQIAALTAAMLDPAQLRPGQDSALGDPAARLALRPLDRAALTQAALEATLSGRRDAARPLMIETVRRDPRAVPARMWLMADAIGKQDLAGAIAQIERVMSVAPSQTEAYFPLLADLARQRGAERPLAAMLARGAYWRPQFLGYLTTRGVNPDLIFRLNNGQLPGAKQDSGNAQAALIQQFIARGDYDGAYVAWVNFLPQEALTKVATVYDGDFAGLPGPQPFNWTLADGDAASVDIDGGRGLRIDYPGSQTTRVANQTLLLKPGNYSLAFVARGSGEMPDGGMLTWQLSCLPANKPILTLPISGLNDRARAQAARFTVPADCHAQLLSIEATLGTFPQTRSVTITHVAIKKEA